MAAVGGNGLIATTPGESRALPLTVRVVAVLNGGFLIVNGLFMLVAPAMWYHTIPGVTETGFFNQHFIRDIGILQVFLGGAFWFGMVRPACRVALWASASLWLVAHAVFHLWEVAVGICAPSAILRDFAGVSLPALLGVAITVWAWSQTRA